MDISNLTAVGSTVPAATTVAGITGANKSVSQGNSLPQPEQVRPSSDVSQNVQNTDSASKLTTEDLRTLVAQSNETLAGRFSDLRFSVAEGTDINVVRIEDSETGELIRQFPSEAMVAIARALDETIQGTMLKEKV